jgi:hypothetical protein
MPRERRLEKRKEELLPTSYFHVVFTLPHELNTIILTRTSRNQTGFKKLNPNIIFVNACMPWVYKEVQKFLAKFVQN